MGSKRGQNFPILLPKNFPKAKKKGDFGCEFFIRYRVHFAGSRKNTKADAAPLPPEGGQAQERTEQMPQTAPLPEDGAKETN